MSYTKGELVMSALNEIGIADYDFDIQPEQKESAMRRLDSMMAEWSAKGILLSYPLPGSANGSELTQDSNVPDTAIEAVITNLAIRIAPSYGKIVLQETKMTAKNSLNLLFSMFSMPKEMQLPSMPKGAGYKSECPYSEKPEDNKLTPVINDFEL